MSTKRTKQDSYDKNLCNPERLRVLLKFHPATRVPQNPKVPRLFGEKKRKVQKRYAYGMTLIGKKRRMQRGSCFLSEKYYKESGEVRHSKRNAEFVTDIAAKTRIPSITRTTTSRTTRLANGTRTLIPPFLFLNNSNLIQPRGNLDTCEMLNMTWKFC